MMEEKPKKVLRNDILLALSLLLIAAILLAWLLLFRHQGDTVQVTVNGEFYGEYSLSQEITQDIFTGEENNQHNRLVIRGGKAFVETATCPDGICAAHSPIFRDGESIVCLPHKVVITVVAKEPNPSSTLVDATA